MGFSCAVDCPGDYPWKKLYNESRITERKINSGCTENNMNPTRDWPPASPGGPYAIAFSGGMRNYVATHHSWVSNVIEVR
jgi:hypothetical protein